jgi:hAT family C-terminal dimerisation region
MTPDMRIMFTHVEGLVHHLLVNPASSATSERSHSSLRRLKTYLRSTCSQQRLNHLAIRHFHKEKLDEINLNQLLAGFVAARVSRATIFGKIDSN